MRTHGVENVTEPSAWDIPGFNFRITDLQASIGVSQLSLLSQKLDKIIAIYRLYESGLKDCPGIRPVPVDVSQGEIPIYNEYLCESRNKLISTLTSLGIGTRRSFPNISRAKYMQLVHPL